MDPKFEKLFQNKVKTAPQQPGCYIWRDVQANVLYIGKAVNLRKRSSSYILNYDRLDPKIKHMVDQINDVEYHIVDSETEALILETNLIKKYRPKYNRLMKDDKSYSWVCIDLYNPYPQIRVVRDQKDTKAEYYGPYPARFPIFNVLKRLRKIFPYCNHLPKNINKSTPTFDSKPCFDTHMGLCTGVCAGMTTKSQHRKNINSVKKFFQGKKLEMVEIMEKEMHAHAAKHNFEQAADLRNRIADLRYVTQYIRIDRNVDEQNLVEIKKQMRERAIEDLFSRLKIQTKNSNTRIECFDISNIQGTNPVASMVVFVDGKPAKDLYRKFKIKTKSTPDDFAMMREAFGRRLSYLSNNLKKDQSFNQLPKLVIIDGGKGQLSSAYSILKEHNLTQKINIVGLAKREEEIFHILESGLEIDFSRTILPRRSEALYLVQRIRDEAHRFAIGFHRKLRSDGQTRSQLDDMPGVGPVIKKRLIEAFGNLKNIQKANLDEINAVVRNKKTAEIVFKLLK